MVISTVVTEGWLGVPYGKNRSPSGCMANSCFACLAYLPRFCKMHYSTKHHLLLLFSPQTM